MRFKNYIQRHPVGCYFITTYIISWLGAFTVAAPRLLNKLPITKLDGLLMFPVMIIGPAAVSIILTRIIEGKQGVRDLWSKMSKWKAAVKWWLFALLIPPSLILLTLLLLRIVVSPVFTPNFFIVGFLFGIPAGLLEEIGWTGFATRKMLSKHSFLKTAVTVGLFWGTWHLPVIDFLGAASPHGKYLLLFFLAFVAILTAMRLLIVSLYVNTGSILLAQFMHIVSTGSLVVFGPSTISPAQETLWYAAYAALLWMVALIVFFTCIRNRTSAFSNFNGSFKG